MDGRHDLSHLDPIPPSGTGAAPSAMDNTGPTGHTNSPQLRPPTYGDLCRPPGSAADASALSAAYHSRYLASLPLSAGSSFPFFGSMLTGAMSAPVTSSFRAPSAHGLSSMRQFWPPTPPPDAMFDTGYGRYNMNPSLFPLFGSMSPTPDTGAYMAQGLISRLSASGHLSHQLIDHKEHGFFSPGFGLSSPLTPSSHVAPPTFFSHLIPSLEKHPSYSHMTLGLKDHHHADEQPMDVQTTKSHHADCSSPCYNTKAEILPSRYSLPTAKPKPDKSECSKKSFSCYSHKEKADYSRKSNSSRHLHSPSNKVTPCEIDVTTTPVIKPDLLSPPIDSPKYEVLPMLSPSSSKRNVSPMQRNSSPSHPKTTENKPSSENHCYSCCGRSGKGVGIATKLNNSESKLTLEPVAPLILKASDEKEIGCDRVSVELNQPVGPTTLSHAEKQNEFTHMAEKSKITSSFVSLNQVSSRCSPAKAQPTEENSNSVFHDIAPSKSCKNDVDSSTSKQGVGSSINSKHVTAAVIPTAPKQSFQRDLSVVPLRSMVNQSTEDSVVTSVPKETASEPSIKYTSALHEIKCEAKQSNLKVNGILHEAVSPFATDHSKREDKINSSLSKVKDLIQAIDSSQMTTSKSHNVPGINGEVNSHCSSVSNVCEPFSTTSEVEQHNDSHCLPFRSNQDGGKLGSGGAFHRGSPSIKSLDYNSASNICSKATVVPFNWQNEGITEEHQAINLTVSKKNPNSDDLKSSHLPANTVPPESSIGSSRPAMESVKILTMENISMTANTGVVGVCHPNTLLSTSSTSKTKTVSVANSVNKFSSVSVTTHPDVTTEVHVSSKSLLQTVRHSATPPNNLKSNCPSVFQSKQLKNERLSSKRGKPPDTEKVLPNPRGTLATLAPKLTKKVGFLKDGKSSHTLSTSSAMSSTSIVFPATVNPCIPVGIAIAQQRQDSSTTIDKTSMPPTMSGMMTSTTHLTSNRIATDMQQTPEVIRDQKTQDMMCSTTSGSTDSTNFLVAQGPTIVSRQWESEVTRAALPSPWVAAHGSVMAPTALWIGQGAYAAANPASSTVSPQPVSSLDSSQLSLPPGGYQLARDPITGHLFLIPAAANIVDRTSVWPSYNSTAGSALPFQQMVTQEHHTQFEQVLPQQTTEPEQHIHDCLSLPVPTPHVAESQKELQSLESCCIQASDMQSSGYKAIEHQTKLDDKNDSNQVPSVPLASGQTFTFTTFPTNCDPASFSYVLQSSTVMHLAHTTSSIQTESGKRSQGTSPLHCATPSPPPNMATEDEGEDESDNDIEHSAISELASGKLSHPTQSVTTAIQVDMDSQTTSEEEYDEDRKVNSSISRMEMSDSAIQTDSLLSDGLKGDSEGEATYDSEGTAKSVNSANLLTRIEAVVKDVENCDKALPTKSSAVEIVMAEAELAPSLPVESKPVMDFIDHHGLNLLVDSIEEFASREKEVDFKRLTDDQNETYSNCDKSSSLDFDSNGNSVKDSSTPQSYPNLDTSCTDGLGLLCALAEQRLEEALNTDNATELNKKPSDKSYDCYSFVDENEQSPVLYSTKKDGSKLRGLPSPQTASLDAPSKLSEGDIEKQIANLQRIYKATRMELARLTPKLNDDGDKMQHQHQKNKIFTLPRFKHKMAPERSVARFLSCDSLKSHQQLKLKVSPTVRSNEPTNKNLKSTPEISSESKEKQDNDLKKLENSKTLNYNDKMCVHNSNNVPHTPIVRDTKIELKISEKPKIDESISNSSEQFSKLLTEDITAEQLPKITGFTHSVPPVSARGKQKVGKKPSATITCGKSLKKKALKVDTRNYKRLKANATNLKKHKFARSKRQNEKKGKVTKFDNEKDEDKSKVPFFDEQAWFVRRSERIFLSDTRPPPTNGGNANIVKKAVQPVVNATSKIDSNAKKKKDVKVLQKSNASSTKPEKDTPKKTKQVNSKQTTKESFTLVLKNSPSSDSSSLSCSSELSVCSSLDSESSDENSCPSDSASLQQETSLESTEEIIVTALKTEEEKQVDDKSSALKNDTITNVAVEQNKIGELQSCILSPNDLQDKTRVLILEDGLFYAGHIMAIQAPDVYGIILDGERAHRPHIFSREEILNAAVLEVKPLHTSVLPEGRRICAYWSQQYRCMYPGTVTKTTSPLPDPSLLNVEFDDGDSGRISLEDIRMLPPDFPVVSTEQPTPLMVLGKRRARIEKETEQKTLNNSGVSKSEKSAIKLQKKSNVGKRTSEDSPKRKGQSDNSPSKAIVNGTSSKKNATSLKVETTDSAKPSGVVKLKGKEPKKRTHSSSTNDVENSNDSASTKPKKRKKHKDEHKHHHKHHHHHHHRHHHKKHKTEKQNHSVKPFTVDSTASSLISVKDVDSKQADSTVTLEHCETGNCKKVVSLEKKSELTMTIKKSPSPHTKNDYEAVNSTKKQSKQKSKRTISSDKSSSSDSSDDENLKPKKKKKLRQNKKVDKKPAKRKGRVPSVEKSKIAAFLPIRQLWKWSGKGYRRPGSKGKAKKEFYRAIQRGKELLRVGDSAVFLSTGRPHLPYIGRIETMWESWGGKMDVKVKWFYHPEETKGGKKLTQMKGALFQSPHFDENDVQTISHKCEVLPWTEYHQKKEGESNVASSSYNSVFDNNDIYYLAGTYDPITGSVVMEPGVPKIPPLATPENCNIK